MDHVNGNMMQKLHEKNKYTSWVDIEWTVHDAAGVHSFDIWML